ncbi:hypothetical protein [Micromonospora sediminicola]|uniref:hypothetical protein n=1 Tax=Micromonospora sediminicola TaxID=946078 RepID=UPI001147723E|nr:hypothetical protein [Micromonospora sediminicola]
MSGDMVGRWEVMISYEAHSDVPAGALDEVSRLLKSWSPVEDAHAHLEDGGAYRATGATVVVPHEQPWGGLEVALTLVPEALAGIGVRVGTLREMIVRPAGQDPRAANH